MIKTEFMWAIMCSSEINKPFLYCGTFLTRQDAIYRHTQTWNVDPILSKEDVRATWKRCRARGDRAVKVVITYTVSD